MTTTHHEFAICEQFQIEEYEAIAADFVQHILGLTPENCCLTDESDLDDFSLMSSTLDAEELSWDETIIKRIAERYGVELTTTRINFLALFAMIERARIRVIH
jgi:hypothetical protein